MISECLACDPQHEGRPCCFRLAQEALLAAHRALGGEAGATGHQRVQARGQRPNPHSDPWLEIYDGEAGEDGSGEVRSVGRSAGAEDDLDGVAAAVATDWAAGFGPGAPA